MYARAGIKYSYAAHLRDTGTVRDSTSSIHLFNTPFGFHKLRCQYGFALPSRFIRPVGEETGKMAEYLAYFITNHSSLSWFSAIQPVLILLISRMKKGFLECSICISYVTILITLKLYFFLRLFFSMNGYEMRPYERHMCNRSDD